MRITTRSPDYVRRAAKSRSDFATAKNIGHKILSAGQKSSSGGATRQLALKSGILNANGEFSPASSEA